MNKLIFDGCAGTKSATEGFRRRGYEVETLDIDGDHTYVMDIKDFHPVKYYSYMHFSPPCNCFSVASVGKHWKGGVPDKETLEAMEIVKACIRIIEEEKLINPDVKWTIENPMNMLRKQDFMIELEQHNKRDLASYCQYDDTAQKKTDFWNNIESLSLKTCNNGDLCHTPAPRGSRTIGTTQGKCLSDRYIIPLKLSIEICNAVERDLWQQLLKR